MKIRNDLRQDTHEWLEFKRTRIGGSGAKSIAVPLSRGVDRTPIRFWELVGAMLTKPLDAVESPTDRGHRLETDAIEELSTIVGLKFDAKPGVWVSDEDDALMLSSDGCEPGEKVTYDAEVKSFTYVGKHFKLLHEINQPRERDFDLVPSDYMHQVLHGFVVNEDLQTRYFVSYCPEAIHEKHTMAILRIDRESVEEEIGDLKENELKTLAKARAIVGELIGEDF